MNSFDVCRAACTGRPSKRKQTNLQNLRKANAARAAREQLKCICDRLGTDVLSSCLPPFFASLLALRGSCRTFFAIVDGAAAAAAVWPLAWKEALDRIRGPSFDSEALPEAIEVTLPTDDQLLMLVVCCRVSSSGGT